MHAHKQTGFSWNQLAIRRHLLQGELQGGDAVVVAEVRSCDRRDGCALRHQWRVVTSETKAAIVCRTIAVLQAAVQASCSMCMLVLHGFRGLAEASAAGGLTCAKRNTRSMPQYMRPARVKCLDSCVASGLYYLDKQSAEALAPWLRHIAGVTALRIIKHSTHQITQHPCPPGKTHSQTRLKCMLAKMTRMRKPATWTR